MATLKNIDINGTLLLDFIYPVGSIYTTTNDSFDPAARFGGTWKKLSGVFLYANESGMSSKSTGGEKTHTLTYAEMPKHSHTYYSPIVQKVAGTTTGNNYGNYNKQYIINTSDSGGGAAHNNMPPYYSCTMWERTA
mgnify:CR=1 FL=1